MISSLKGKISRIGNNFIEIEVHDVGYLVHGPAVAKAMAGKVGQEVKIYTYMSVSETDIS